MVDILLATYNGEKYLREQLDSLLSQTYKDIRIIIHDDGSYDGTVNVIKEYRDSFRSKIVYIEDEVSFGDPGRNFAFLLGLSKGDYVMFCDQDDVWDKDKVRLMLGAMKAAEKKYDNTLPLVVFSDYEVVDENLNPLDVNEKNLEVAKHYTTFNRLIVQNYVTGCTMIINRRAADMFGEYDERMDMHDWWIALYTSAIGKVVHFPKKLMLYRQHSGNEVGAKDVKSFRYRLLKLLDPATRNAKNDAYDAMELLDERFGDELPDKSRKLLDDFLLMRDKPKIQRVRTLVKYRILKSDMVRSIGQMFYI